MPGDDPLDDVFLQWAELAVAEMFFEEVEHGEEGIGRVERDGERVSCSGGGRNGRLEDLHIQSHGLGIASMVGNDEEKLWRVDERVGLVMHGSLADSFR